MNRIHYIINIVLLLLMGAATPTHAQTFTGNIYGGGALGAVEGATNGIIKGGIINGDVFGAGKGEEGHINKAKVTGSTNVVVDNQ